MVYLRLNIDDKSYNNKPEDNIGILVDRLKNKDKIVVFKDYATGGLLESFYEHLELYEGGELNDDDEPHVDDYHIKEMDIGKLKSAILDGRTITAGELIGTTSKDWRSQQVFIFDVDNEAKTLDRFTPKCVEDLFKEYNIPILFAYWTFSNTPEHQKFRVVTMSHYPVYDSVEAEEIIRGIMSLFPTVKEKNRKGNFVTVSQVDLSCTNLDRMFFGTNQGLVDGIGVLRGNKNSNIVMLDGTQTFDKQVALTLFKASKMGKEKYKKERESKFIKPTKKKSVSGEFDLGEEISSFDLLDYILNTTDCTIVRRTGNYYSTEHGYDGREEVMLNPCPICEHDDNFTVNIRKNVYYCHSDKGHIGGSIINYLMTVYNIEKIEAIEMFKFSILKMDKGEDELRWRREYKNKSKSTNEPADGEINEPINKEIDAMSYEEYENLPINNNGDYDLLEPKEEDEDDLDWMIRVSQHIRLKSILPRSYSRPINKISKELPKRLNTGQEWIKTSGEGYEETQVRFEMWHEDEDCEFTPFDHLVHDAIWSLYKVGNITFTAKMVYHAMNGKINSSGADKGGKIINQIKESIKKLTEIMIDIDYSQEVEHTPSVKNNTRSKYKGSLINCLSIKAITGKKYGEDITEDAYKLLAEPVMYSYTAIRNQIMTVDIKHLQAKGNTDKITIIRSHLLRNIWEMKDSRSYNRNSKISYFKIYELFGLHNHMKGRDVTNKLYKMRDRITNVLEGLKKTGYIISYEEYKATDKASSEAIGVKIRYKN